MPDSIKNTGRLIAGKLLGSLSPAEQAALDAWIREDPANLQLYNRLQDAAKLSEDLRIYAEAEKLKPEGLLLLEPFMADETPVRRMPASRRWWSAAAILILLGTGTYFWITNKKDTSSTTVAYKTDIAPGKEGAVLTLADGSQVVLDSLGNGIVAMQGGTAARIANGSLIYEGKGDQTVYYNTISTPKGRQFHLTLPDGTGVWLNAASSLRYPTVFTGDTRKVEVTGEAYFEVVKNKEMPFHVQVNNKAAVEVLGTHFDINAYANEQSINTTLIEGSVRVSASSGAVTLQPGQQAQVSGTISVVDDPDIDKIMAWKNGFFNFSGASLGEVMRQLERWYDIEVVYEKDIPQKTFYGKISRDISLRSLLIVLEKTGVRFRIEGRKLIVLPTDAN